VSDDPTRGGRGDPDGDEPVPRLPRGRGLKFSTPELFRIILLGIMLVAVVVLARPCAAGMSNLIEMFEPEPDAGAAPSPVVDYNLPPGDYVRLTGTESEEELIEKLGRGGDAGPKAGEPAHDPAVDPVPDPVPVPGP
jgi:hypothetical protein